ncbi:antibiotic biosynthesis monooxygenase family protein [Pseudoxanthomonas sp. PXM02]|uniref:antibiotic biosynthesis monooxygenase family protein n=1 Tax=Pseudoxanthomonas sp. PXM02 TaxID=2769294 RepID=UPI00177CDAF4|nr:antibiotic biosynthesis monooxygenase family protein [Pseudoxanthomonas sp. PXM02]MBD9480783.1 antibiotic biosynthesis monooxygenase [Pseudoxanthomonas sp. PXM02]
MVEGLGFCVIYRARVHPEKEAKYVAAWSRLTSRIRDERGGLGSRLHKGDDGLWYAYAQWPSEQARADAFARPSADPAAQADMADCIIEHFPEIRLTPVNDHLVPASTWSADPAGDLPPPASPPA